MPIIRTGCKSRNTKDRQFTFRTTGSLIGAAGLPAPTIAVQGILNSGTSITVDSTDVGVGDSVLSLQVTSLAGTVTAPSAEWRHVGSSPIAEGACVRIWQKIISEDNPTSAAENFSTSGLEWASRLTVSVRNGSLNTNTFSTFTQATPGTTHTFSSGTIGLATNAILLAFGRGGDEATAAFPSPITTAGNLTSVSRIANNGTTTGSGGGLGFYSALCGSSTSGTVSATTTNSYASCGLAVAFEPSQTIPR